ncbi:MFS transporter [Nonomuraea insulae]|uniref:MFS transporter n=1 Tax=Nonomuraea insulae TaxID=1616787 RepID=A0ABW1D7Y1_9ACTN
MKAQSEHGTHARQRQALLADKTSTRPRVLRQVMLAQAVLGFTINSLGACLVLLAADLGSPPEELVWLSSSFGIGLLVIGLLGRWALRPGPQRVLPASALVAAVGATLLATGIDPVTTAIGALLLGLGTAGFAVVTPALLSGPNAEVGLTKAIAVASVAALLGLPTIGAVTAAGFSGRLALLLAVPPLLLLAFNTRPRGTTGAYAERSTGIDGGGPGRGTSTGRRHRLRLAGVWAAIVIAVAIEFCFTIWSTARLQDTGLPTGAAAAVATTFLVGMAAGRLVTPRLVGRGIAVVPAGCALAAAGTVVVALSNTPVSVTSGLALAGLGIAPFYPVTLARFVQMSDLPPIRSSAYGAVASGSAVLMAPAGLAALGTTLGLQTAYLVAVLPMTLALAGATLLRDERQT